MSERSTSRAAARARALAACVLVLLLLAACGGSPGAGTGTVSGRVTVGVNGGSSASPGAVPLEPRGDPSGSPARSDVAPALDRPFVPGELIVAFEPSVQAAAVSRLSAAGATLEAVRSLAAEGALLYRTAADTLPEALALAAALEARPDVRYAHPNYLLFPALAPNDPEYDRQWHYDAIDMEGAWDITTGASDIVVAVLDTGILYSQSDPTKRHPDLVGRVLPGYDFISNPSFAADGDGRDPDPYDTAPQNDYHGTHVAGTIGAATDNGLGVAGVDWEARILPLRVLGAGGGSVADVADAIEWAVGRSVPGVPSNPYPADVINLSLGGGADECYDVLYEAISVASQSAIVVAASGNDNEAANGFTPANCPGPIVVGATDRHGDRAWYSNYGSRIDVMAPGGDTTVSVSEGVLSTGASGGYTFMQGTSMAAPHVSGVVSLMLSLDPTVTTVEALEMLRASATPLTNSECEAGGGSDRTLYGFDCGAGLIDARVALELLGGSEPPPPTEEGVALAFTPPVLDLGATLSSGVVTVTNVGDETAEWSFDSYYEEGAGLDNPGPVPEGAVEAELVADPDAPAIAGTLEPGESAQVRIYINRSFLSEDGFYAIQPVFEAGGEEFYYQVRFAKSSASTAELLGPMVVAALQEDEQGNLQVSGSQSSPGVITTFQFDVRSGQNLLSAWSDENGNDEVDEGDFLGYHPTWVTVPAGGLVTGVDVSLLPVVGSRDVPEGLLEALQGAPR